MIKAEAWASHWSNTDPKTTNNQIHRIEKTMIDALIGGKVHGQPQQKTTKAGKPFAVAKVKVPTGDGQAVPSIWFRHTGKPGVLVDSVRPQSHERVQR